jgi:hypothetical protein
MTPPSRPEQAPDEPADTDLNVSYVVDEWRHAQLLLAGYTDPIAAALAELHEVDLHVACDLIARGCPEATAYLILAP